jgi:hypothetical protein
MSINALEHLVDFTLARGHVVSVFDGGEWCLVASGNRGAILSAIGTVEVAEISISQNGERIGWALVSAAPYAWEPEETVMDTCTRPFMDAWSDKFNRETGA